MLSKRVSTFPKAKTSKSYHTMYVCITKKNSSSIGTENNVGPMTASAGYASTRLALYVHCVESTYSIFDF